MKTKQEIFDTVLTHLRAQKVPAKRNDGACMYRGPNETKCAVGCLIPDEIYDSTIEDIGIMAIMNGASYAEPLKECLQKSEIPTDYSSLKFLCKLQRMHDCELDFEDSTWEDSMYSLACEHHLNFKEIQE